MKLFIEQEIKYNEDAMPVRGLLRSKLCFGFKVGAYNFKNCSFWVLIKLYNGNEKFDF